MVAALQARFQQGGYDLSSASHRAMASLYSMVQHQASVMSYLDEFRILAALFVLVAPLVWIMRKPQFKERG